MSLTVILCVITGVVSYAAFENRGLFEKLKFYPYQIKRRGEWYRFLTHGFVHGSYGHLFMNLFVLWQFGRFVNQLFSVYFGAAISTTLLLVFYISAIIFASVYSYIKHQDNPRYASIGASGATSAILVGYVIYDPWQWFLFPPLPSILMLVGYLWYSNKMEKENRDNIGHDAHFYGAVYGIVFLVVVSLFLNPQLLTDFALRFMEGPKMPPFLNL